MIVFLARLGLAIILHGINGAMQGNFWDKHVVDLTPKQRQIAHIKFMSFAIIICAGTFPYSNFVWWVKIELGLIWYSIYMTFHQGAMYAERHRLKPFAKVYYKGFFSDGSNTSSSWWDRMLPFVKSWHYRLFLIIASNLMLIQIAFLYFTKQL